MNETWVYIKEHKWTIAAVLGAIILFYLFYNYFGGGSTTVIAGTQQPSDAAVAAAAQVQGQTLQAGVATQQVNAQLDAQNNATAAAVAIAQLTQQTQGNANVIAGNVALAGLDVQKALGSESLNTEQAIAAINAGVTNNETAATQALGLASLATQYSIAQNNNATIVAQSTIAAAAQTNQAKALLDSQLYNDILLATKKPTVLALTSVGNAFIANNPL
jgi:hypothetical protein